MNFTETEARSNPSYTQLTSKEWEGEKHEAQSLETAIRFHFEWEGENDTIMAKVCSVINQVTLFLCSEEDLFHSKIFLLSMCRSKDSWEKGNITDSQFDYSTKIKFIKYQQQFNK